MVKCKTIFNSEMDSRKKIQIYPSSQHCGYNKMSNNLTKTIMSPLTTMPAKKMMVPPQISATIKPNYCTTQNMSMQKNEKPAVTNNIETKQISVMRNVPLLKSSNVVSEIPNPTEKTDIKNIKSAAFSYRSEKISLDDVHPYITCTLCKGYLIEATTIVECLHTFCHSCLMKHLAREKCCPQCDMSINKTKTNIKYDATIQSMVFKLVPGLYQKELLRRRAFYRRHPEEAKLARPEERGDDTEHLILSPLDLISLSLDYAEKETLSGMESDQSIQNLLRPKYLNCPAIFKVEHLKKFIVSKFFINSNRFNVEISYKVKTIVLPEHYTLMDIAYIYTWKKEAPMPFFFRIIAKNSKCDELPEVALRRSPTITVPNITEGIQTKKKSVSFKESVESIESDKSSDSSRKSSDNNAPNPPKIETIKLKLDASSNNVRIIKNHESTTTKPKSDKKHKQSRSEKKDDKVCFDKFPQNHSNEREKGHSKNEKKDEYEFDDDEIDPQKLGFLNTFQLTAKKNVDQKLKINAKPSQMKSEGSPTNNKNNLSQKQTENSINKRKSKEPVRSAQKKYKFHEMKSISEGNKFVFTKTGDGHEITFDMSPKPLGSKPSLSEVKCDILLAQQRADDKANKDLSAKSAVKVASNPEQEKLANISKNVLKNVPIKPKKLPMLLPKQPFSAPASNSPTAFVIKKPETKQPLRTSEISVTKVDDSIQPHQVYGPPRTPSPVKPKEPSSPIFKSPDGFAHPLPPKPKVNTPSSVPTQILKPYGYPIKMPKNIPENMQTPYGCRTPFYVPSSPSYTPNFDLKPQFKYANPNAYASFMQSMFCAAPSVNKTSPPMDSPKSSSEISSKRPVSDSPGVASKKRKSASPSKNTETDSKAICILNKINFPSSLSVTLTNEQEENKKEQLRNKKQSIVNNNIEIIKISEEKESKAQSAKQSNSTKASSNSPPMQKSSSPSDPKTILPKSPVHTGANSNALMNPAQLLSPPVAKALTESKESFQRAFLESLMSVASKQQNLEKTSPSQKREHNKSSNDPNEKDDKFQMNAKKEESEAREASKPLITPKSFCKMTDAPQSSARKHVSLTPPPSKSNDASSHNTKSLTPPLINQDSVFTSNATQAMQLNMMLNALNAATKSPFAYTDLANIQRTMLLETLRKNVEKSNALLAYHQIQQQQQQNEKNSSLPNASSSAKH